MNFLKDKRRAGAIGLLGALIGAAALFLGAGAAHAGYPCNDNPAPQDINVNFSNIVFAGADAGIGIPGWYWVCVGAPNGEASQKWVVVTTFDPGGGTNGAAVQAGGCTGVVPGDPFAPGCTYLLEQTGADVVPSTSVNPPASGAAGTGGSAGVGTGTCAYVNGTPTCPFGFTVAGVTVNESDASVPTTHPNSGGCVTVPGNPCVTTAPDGFGVGVLKGDATRDTVTVTIPGSTESKDLGGCVGFNAGSGC